MHGDGDAVRRLAEIGNGPATDSELRKVRWLARAYLAQTRCASAPGLAHAELEAIVQDMQSALPEGGAVLRDVSGIRNTCQ